jgi:hypothetical protein
LVKILLTLIADNHSYIYQMESTQENYCFAVEPAHYGIHALDSTGTRFALFHRDIRGSPYPLLRPLTLVYDLDSPLSAGRLPRQPYSMSHTCGAITKVEFQEPHYLRVTVDSMSVYFLSAPEALTLEYAPPVEGFPPCSRCGRTSGAGTCLDFEAEKLI